MWGWRCISRGGDGDLGGGDAFLGGQSVDESNLGINLPILPTKDS